MPSAVYERDGAVLDAVSDAVDEVNMLRGRTASSNNNNNNNNNNNKDSNKSTEYDEASRFDAEKDKAAFRQYTAACDRVRDFYYEQHAKQTVAFNLAARTRFHSVSRERPLLSVWEAIERLDQLVDDSDPDTQLSQAQHLLQSAEAIRRDGKPRWMQLTGLIHDLGKLMLVFFDEENKEQSKNGDGSAPRRQWDVVGDTFPVGCAADRRCIFPESFAANPDARDPVFGTPLGIYAPGCGMENLLISWGHDEYLYLVVRDQSTLPREALAMIRFHSFYPWHREGAYRGFMAEGDDDLLRAVQAFNPYDLYSKSDGVPSIEELKPYYLELIDEFFPAKKIRW